VRKNKKKVDSINCRIIEDVSFIKSISIVLTQRRRYFWKMVGGVA
jgi:hypothetical protein